jgi:hypothetical protein
MGDLGKVKRKVWIPEPNEVPTEEPVPAVEPAAEPEPVPA